MKKEQAQKTFEEMKEVVARNPFASHIGMELLELSPGYARGRIPFKSYCENIYGAMHGGCAFTLADTLAGVAVASYGVHVTTLNASINYMRPVSDTEYLYCTANVQRNGGKVSVVRTELMDERGKLLIDGSFTYYHLE